MNQLKNRHDIGITLSILFGIVVFGIVAWRLSTLNDSALLTKMRLEAGGNGQKHCADFVANEDMQDQITITITNCGENPIVVKVKNSQKGGGELAADEEYSTELPPGVKEFDVNIETFEGELLGGFKL